MIKSGSFCDHLKLGQDLDAEIWFDFVEHCKSGARVCSHFDAHVSN